ncbi:MAG: cell division protein FtsA [Opitutaceae bacterium]|nr:cell division protein FtsA [Opitutaceae bacterium]
MSSRTKYIGAVEIGTSKISVLIGEIANGRSLSVVGLGECASRGVIKGVVMDFKAASDVSHSALLDAEKSAGVRVDEVYLAQTGGHIDGFSSEATVRVAAADNMVSDFDVSSVCYQARIKQLPPGRMVVQRLRRPFLLDGRLVPDPDSLVGNSLSVSYFMVHGQEARIADNIHVIRGFNVRVSELILSSLASGIMVTTPGDRQHGVLVLDIGAGTTDYVLYRDGMPQVAGVVAVGGAHVTNDLALGLRLTEGQAEKLKLRFGRATVATRSRDEKVWLNGDFAIGDRQFPKQTIEHITSARAWEILEVVRKKLGSAMEPQRTGAGIVITGGGSKLPGMAEAASKVFGIPAHISEGPSGVKEYLRDPGFSTVLGLLHYGLSASPEVPAPARRRTRIFQKLFATV